MLYITLRQYEYIVAIAEAGGLTQAAKLLNVSQPSLSVAVTRVEQKLGQPIFVRGKGVSITITPFGHQVVKKARALLTQAAQLEQEGTSIHPFVLGCFQDIAPWYLAPALDFLHETFPDISFAGQEGSFSDIAQGLAKGKIDLAISYDVGFDSDFKTHSVAQITPIAFVHARHPLAAKPSIELDDLAAYPLILFKEDQSEGFVQSVFKNESITPNVKHRVTTLELMRSLAAHGSGVGVSYTCPPGNHSYDGKELVAVPITSPQARSEISLIWSALRQETPDFRKISKTLSGMLRTKYHGGIVQGSAQNLF